MNVSNLIRVVGAALVLSTLSFAAGIAGDLSLADPPNFGERVVLRIPPEIAADAPRAAPLPSLLSTASAEAHVMTPRRRFEPIEVNFTSFQPLEASWGEPALLALPKMTDVFGAKPDHCRKSA